MIKQHQNRNKRKYIIKYHYDKLWKEIKTLIFNKFFYADKLPIYKLNSGISSKYYFDTRHMMQKWLTQNQVAHMFRYKILLDLHENNTKDTSNIMVGGMETGAILLSQAIINCMSIDTFYVRKEEKDHGNQRRIVTPNDLNNKKIIIIDDVVTSGKSINLCKNFIRYYYPNCDIWKIYTLIDRSVELNFDPFKNWTEDDVDKISYFSFYDSEEDFINLLTSNKHVIKQNDKRQHKL